MSSQNATLDDISTMEQNRPSLPPARDRGHGYEDGTWVQNTRSQENDARFARGLGWFSVGLGLAELLAPGPLSRLIGVREHRVLMPLLGIRELASGVGILANPKPASWVWSRVAGDMMDLALLGAALSSGNSDRGKVAAATAAVIGVTAIDITCSQLLSGDRRMFSRMRTDDGAIRVRKSTAINRSPEECYRFWRDFENLPRFMKHLESVQVRDGRRSHWVTKGPAGTHVEWDAEIIDETPNRFIAWRSVEGSDVSNRGSISFEEAPSARGTLVRSEIEYMPPGGAIGSIFARLFGEEPEQQVADDLRRFKQLMETGEIPTTEGQPAGRSSMFRGINASS